MVPVTYGTIGLMSNHRVRFTDYELAWVVAALKARAAGVSPTHRREILRLADRLAECSPGNPFWALGWADEPSLDVLYKVVNVDDELE